jgi:hypothetical protein
MLREIQTDDGFGRQDEPRRELTRRGIGCFENSILRFLPD